MPGTISTVVGKQFELWQSEFVKAAYEDQMGMKHDAKVVRRKVIVTVTETRDIDSPWSGKTIQDGLWIAKDASGIEYRQELDETSMAGRYSWSDSLKQFWHGAQRRGWFEPYINPDGTKAVPVELPAVSGD